MEYRSLDLTIISAKDLKDVQHIGKQNVYTVVSINGDEGTKQQTPVHKDSGTEPKWKHTMKFTIDEASAQQNLLTLVIHFMADRHLVSDKLVGEVHLPVKELLDGETGECEYSVKMPNGETKGTLKLSYKLGDKYVSNQPVIDNPQHGDTGASEEPKPKKKSKHGGDGMKSGVKAGAKILAALLGGEEGEAEDEDNGGESEGSSGESEAEDDGGESEDSGGDSEAEDDGGDSDSKDDVGESEDGGGETESEDKTEKKRKHRDNVILGVKVGVKVGVQILVALLEGAGEA